MDIEKLIEQLRTESLYADKASLEIMDLCMEAANALSTLQAENEKLLEMYQKEKAVCHATQAELEQVKRERDEVLEDLRKHRKYKCDCCYYADKQSRFPCADCQSPISTYGDGWKWLGPKED